MLMTIVLIVATLYLVVTAIEVAKNAGYLKETVMYIVVVAIAFAANAIFMANVFGIIIMSICLVAPMIETHICAFNKLSEYVVALSQETAIYMVAIAGPIAKMKDRGVAVSCYSLFVTIIFITSVAFLITHRVTNKKALTDDDGESVPVGAGITAFWLFFSILGLTILGLGFKIEIAAVALMTVGAIIGIILAIVSIINIRRKYGGH